MQENERTITSFSDKHLVRWRTLNPSEYHKWSIELRTNYASLDWDTARMNDTHFQMHDISSSLLKSVQSLVYTLNPERW